MNKIIKEEELDTQIISINNLKKIKVVSSNKILNSKIDDWIEDGFSLIGGIINCICEVPYMVNFTDVNIGNLSFRCESQNGDLLFVQIFNNGYNFNEKSGIAVTVNNVTKKYICASDKENIYLTLDSVIKLDKNNIIYLYRKKKEKVNNNSSNCKFKHLFDASQKFPEIHLPGYGERINFDVEEMGNKIAVDGFIEKYCLDDKQRAELKRIRKKK